MVSECQFCDQPQFDSLLSSICVQIMLCSENVSETLLLVLLFGKDMNAASLPRLKVGGCEAEAEQRCHMTQSVKCSTAVHASSCSLAALLSSKTQTEVNSG